MNILFRTDASQLIGSGHIMRCRTLARELRRKGANITFVCREQEGDLINLISQEFRVLRLRQLKSYTKKAEVQNKDEYASWLGCTQAEDANDTIKKLVESGDMRFDWIIVDHYGIDKKWEDNLISHMKSNNNSSVQLMVIDDLANRPHNANCLLDQEFYGEDTKTRYKTLVPDDCMKFLGPKYALLAPEYSKLKKLMPARSRVKRILIYFGGVDLYNYTALTLEAIKGKELEDIEIDVVIGMQSKHRSRIIREACQNKNITIHEPLSSLAGLIARADLAIGAGGGTSLERLSLGLPSINFVIAANQLESSRALANYFKKSWMCINTKISPGELQDIIKHICLSDYLLKAISAKLLEFTDGKGTCLISDYILTKSRSQ